MSFSLTPSRSLVSAILAPSASPPAGAAPSATPMAAPTRPRLPVAAARSGPLRELHFEPAPDAPNPEVFHARRRALVFSARYLVPGSKNAVQKVLMLFTRSALELRERSKAERPIASFAWPTIARYGSREAKCALQLVHQAANGTESTLAFVFADAVLLEWAFEAVAYFVTEAYVGVLRTRPGAPALHGATVDGSTLAALAGSTAVATAPGAGAAAATASASASATASTSALHADNAVSAVAAVRERLPDRLDALRVKLRHWAFVHLVRRIEFEAGELVRAVRDDASVAIDDLVPYYRDRVAQLRADILANPMWSVLASAAERLDGQPSAALLLELDELLEAHYAALTYAAFFPDHKLVALDAKLSARIAALQFIKAEHLDLTRGEVLESTPAFEAAVDELRQLNAARCPRLKVSCVLAAVSHIYSVLGEAAGADELLPCLVLATLRANPPLLRTNIEYCLRFRSERALAGEDGYYLTQVWSATRFLADLTAAGLSGVSAEQFARALGLPLGDSSPTAAASAVQVAPAGPSEPKAMLAALVARGFAAADARRALEATRFESMDDALAELARVLPGSRGERAPDSTGPDRLLAGSPAGSGSAASAEQTDESAPVPSPRELVSDGAEHATAHTKASVARHGDSVESGDVGGRSAMDAAFDAAASDGAVSTWATDPCGESSDDRADGALAVAVDPLVCQLLAEREPSALEQAEVALLHAQFCALWRIVSNPVRPATEL